MKKVRVNAGNFIGLLITLCILFGQLHAPGRATFRSLIHTLKLGAQKRGAIPFIQSFFPPQDRVERLLCELIEEEDLQIDIAAYQLTNKRVAQSLIDAYRRGVKISVVADVAALGRFTRVLDLSNAGIPIFVYPKSGISEGSLMHNKIMIFHALEAIVTGSMNLTKAGMETNEENVLVVQYTPLFNDYVRQFAYLITRATPLGNHGAL